MLTFVSSIAHSESLLEVVENAVNNNLDIASAQAGLQSSSWDKSISLTEFLPSISASANTAWNESTTEQVPGPDIENEYNEHGYRFTLNQTLFDLGRLFRFSQARRDYSIEKLRFQNTLQETISSTFNNYVEVLKLYARRLTTELELESAKARLDQVSKNVAAGNVAKSSLFEAQAKVSTVETSLIDVQKRINLSLAKLYKDAGYHAWPSFDIDPSMSINEIDATALNLFKEQLNDSNLDVLIARQSHEKNRSSLNEKRSKFAPTISADINYSVTDTNNAASNTPPSTGESDSTSYRVTLNLPIFSGGERFFTVEKAKQDAKKSRIELDNAYQKALLKLKEVVLEINADARSVDMLKSSIQANNESFRGQKRAYELGTRTLSDVLSAEKLLYDSLRTYFDTQYDYLKNLVTVQSLLGTLTVDAIEEISSRMLPHDPSKSRRKLEDLLTSINEGKAS